MGKSLKNKQNKIVKWFWVIVLAPFVLIFTMLLAVWLFAKIPSFEELEHPDNKLATLVLADNGEVLTTFHIENRTYVGYDDLSPYLVQAAVATEDERFYSHSGIDTKSFFRVLVKTLLLRDSSQGGGSTITQQLAKTLYPRQNISSNIPGVSSVKMVWTKMKEWITAVKLERDYTKNEIVDMYLNSIFFGSGAYGIKAASETFFNKEPSALTLEESALLVGMVNKPTRYNPTINPAHSLARRNFVIGKMARKGYITAAQKDSLCLLPLKLDYHVVDHNSGLAPYFRDMIRRDMVAKRPQRSKYQYPEEYAVDSLRWEEDPLYGWLNKNTKADGSRYNLDKDGLRIHTTINARMQRYAEEAVAEYLGKSLQKSFNAELRWKQHKPFANDVETSTINVLMAQARRWSDRYYLQSREGLSEPEILAQFSKKVKMRVFSWNSPKGYIDTVMTPDDSIRYYKSIIRAGFVAMEPGTGQVKAYVGGPNYRYFKYDNARQGKRQVGSTIKPYLYTSAMLSGYSPCDKCVCMPQTFNLFDGTTWTPRSTDPEQVIGSTVTLKWGLAHSSNNISAFLMKQLGPEGMVAAMRRMGIAVHLDEVYALCVGSADIAPFDMVASYNTFPSGGVYVSPIYVTSIEDENGNVLSAFSNKRREAISAETTGTMVKLMAGVINEGTGVRLRHTYALKGQISGKTGTTNDNSDGWFIGYTPSITAGVWVGWEDRQVHFNSLALGSGSNMALPIWGIWMNKCLQDGTLGLSEEDEFSLPDNSDKFNCEANPGVFLGGYPEDYKGPENKSENKEEENYYFN